jgi:tape measure domain-containing protein
LRSASARGDEAQAMQAQNRLGAIENEQLQLTARAKNAQAAALEATTAARREELAALGPLTRAQQQELQASENAAKALRAQGAASAAASQATAGHTQRIAQMGGVTTDLAAKLSTLQNIIGTVFGVQIGTQLLSDLAKTADAYNNLSARIKISTGEGAAFEAAMAGVQRVAVATRSSLEETANLYTRISEAGKTLKLSQDQVLGLVQTINQAIQVSGGSADSAQAAIVQLNQALQSGVLRGEEFNSIMEQSPRVAKALADGLGVGIGKLREMAEAGRLSSEVVIAALRGQSDDVAAEFAKLPPTVGGALQNLSTAWTVYVGDVDKASGASKTAADAINALSRNLEEVAGFLAGAGQAAASLYALNLAQRFLGIGQAATASAGQIAANTKSTLENAIATQDNAAAQAAHARASQQDEIATTADTAATKLNTAATRENAGVNAAAAASSSKNAESWKTLGTELGSTSAKARAAAGAMSAGAAETGKLGAAAVNAAAKKGILSTAIGAAGGAARGFMALLGGPLGLITLTAMFAEDIGKLAGRFSLWVTGQKTLEQSTKELEAAQRKEAEAARAVAEAREKQTAADKAAADAKFGLNDRGKELIAQFDDLIKKGDSAADAISKIGQDFDLSTQPGIQAAAGVLDKLVADGKISAELFQAAWSKALQGVDLVKFKVDFKAMLLNLEVEAEKAGKAVEQAIARGASKEVIDALRLKAEQAAQAVANTGQRMATVFDVTLNEAIRRTGLDMDLIAKGMGKASVSAINDVDSIINGLEVMSVKGIDTARVLGASLSKAINTADGQKALDLLAGKIEQVRSVLGDKVADGLLDQLADKADALADAMDESLPGIQSVEEAMKKLGLTSEYTLGTIADNAKKAYEAVKNSGVASADEVGKAFAAAAEKAIAANKGLAPEWVKAEAAARGYKIEVDEAGKATLKLASAQDGAAQAFAKAGEAIKAKTAAMKADSDLIVSGLELRKSELDASIKIAEANGDEAKAIKLKIEQKRIEIQIIQETVKAQIAEAQASADMARAKLSELQATGSLTVEKKAELQAQIKGAEASINQAKARGQSVRTIEEEIKALQASSSGYDKNASFINQTTAALEKMNAAREKEIAAQEKKIQLDEREQELYRKKWQMDKEGYSVDADGKRIEQVNETQQSIYNKGKDAGLTAKQAQELADRFAPRGKDQFFRNDEFWKEVNRLKQLNDLAEEELKNKPAAPAPSPAPAAPAPSPAPIRVPAPAPAPRQTQQPSGGGGSASITGPSAPGAVGGLGNTYISNITIPGVGRASPRFADADSQAQVEGLIRQLVSAQGAAIGGR